MNGARVLLVEEKKFPRAKLCGEFISPECFAHFKRLGVAEEMLAAGGVSLSQTAVWIRKLGLSQDRMDTVKALNAGEVDTFRVHSDSGFGPMTHLRVPVQMSATPARWKRPVVPLGTHEAVWPAMLA